MTTTAGQSETKIIVFIFTILLFFSFRLYCNFNVLRGATLQRYKSTFAKYSQIKKGNCVHQITLHPQPKLCKSTKHFPNPLSRLKKILKARRLATPRALKFQTSLLLFVLADTTETQRLTIT